MIKRLLLCRLLGFHDFRAEYYGSERAGFLRYWFCLRECGWYDREEITEEVFRIGASNG